MDQLLYKQAAVLKYVRSKSMCSIFSCKTMAPDDSDHSIITGLDAQ